METIVFPTFLGLVRQRAEDEPHESLEDTLRSVISANEGWTDVAFVEPLNERDGFQERAFDALISSPQIQGIALINCLPSLFARALSSITRLGSLVFHAFPMTESEAEDIFASLRACTVVESLSFKFGFNDYSDGVVRTFCRFLRESLTLTRVYLGGPDFHRQRNIPFPSFEAICSAISESRSLVTLVMLAPVEQISADRVVDCLATACVTSSSLDSLMLSPDQSLLDMDRVQRALLSKDTVRNSDLCFRLLHEGHEQLQAIFFCRHCCWWKVFLEVSDILPLKYWPHVLAKANLSRWSSHKPHDVMFYLLKEKNGVLFRGGASKRRGKSETSSRKQLSGQKRKIMEL